MRLRSLLILLTVCAFTSAADLTIVPDHADGCYAVGEPVTWIVTGDTTKTGLPYAILASGHTEIAKGALNLTGGMQKLTTRLDRPGTLLLRITVSEKRDDLKADKKAEKKFALGGAAVAWKDIKPSAPEPADFDTFWKDKISELAAVPMNPVLEEIDSGVPGVQLWKITMDNIRGSRIHGYLARRTGSAPAPAMLQVQHAGTHALKKEWAVDQAKKGWLSLNILAHDLPVDRDDAFYVEQFNGPLKNYKHQGAEDRDKSYFLRMYLSCYRAVDYLAGRADWNKTTLLVQGGSQGGMQSVVVAALHPAVTTITAEVPAGCDLTGLLVGRAIGFPYWITNETGAERDALLKACGYYDVVNFARRVHCPVLVGMGLIDVTSPAESVLAMFNQISAPKRLVIMPNAEHSSAHAAYEALKAHWWKAAAAGTKLPLE